MLYVKITVFRNVMPCRLVAICQCSRGICCLQNIGTCLPTVHHKQEECVVIHCYKNFISNVLITFLFAFCTALPELPELLTCQGILWCH